MKKIIYSFALVFTIIGFSQIYSQSWLTIGRECVSESVAVTPQIALGSDNTPFVAFSDWAHDKKISVMKYDGSNWVYIGTPGFTDSLSYKFSFALNSKNEPYVFYTDMKDYNRAIVKKFDGQNWVMVGTKGFTNSSPMVFAIAIDNNDYPYVVYDDDGYNGDRVSVKKFDGKNWDYVGKPGFSDSSVSVSQNVGIIFNDHNIPYISYAGGMSNHYGFVMKFDGLNWDNIGNSFFSDSVFGSSSLAINKNDEPYVVFNNWYAKMPSIMKYDGSAWMKVGNLDKYVNNYYTTNNLVIDKNNIPFLVCYKTESGRPVGNILKLNGTDWIPVGDQTYLDSNIYSISIAIDHKNISYILYLNRINVSKATVKYFGNPNYVNDENSMEYNFSIYPNPANDMINITSPNPNYTTATITIVNDLGSILFKGAFSEKNISVSPLPIGIYYCIVQSGNQIEAKKFMIIR